MLTAEKLRTLLVYENDTGDFRWIKAVPKRPAGSIAGTDKGNGYRCISIGGKLYLSHRLAWLYVYGAWPSNNIDHINGDPGDNRISNLRECNQVQNSGNWKKAHKRNKSGYRGVYRISHTGKWCATIQIGGRSKYLGCFASPEQASIAYRQAAFAYFGEFFNAD